MKKIFVIILFVFISFSFTACEEKLENNLNDEIETISYGTSFGECLGYCINTIEVKDSEIVFMKNGWDESGLLPEVKLSESIGEEEWNSMVQVLDFDSFLSLDSVIGCPDCADGGAEWIEISRNNVSYKVTFEYSHEPQSLESIIGSLRVYMDDLKNSSR